MGEGGTSRLAVLAAATDGNFTVLFSSRVPFAKQRFLPILQLTRTIALLSSYSILDAPETRNAHSPHRRRDGCLMEIHATMTTKMMMMKRPKWRLALLLPSARSRSVVQSPRSRLWGHAYDVRKIV